MAKNKSGAEPKGKSQMLVKALACFKFGDFYLTRKLAKAMCRAEDTKPEEREDARKLLFMTGIDPVVLLVGSGVLVFVIVAAFLAAY